MAGSSILAGWLLWAAGQPGWMTTDSRHMFASAIGEKPYSDWYSAVLEWFWTALGADHRGPSGPHTLQVLTYSVGVLLVALAVRARRPVLAVALPWLMMITPALWSLQYVWRDAFMMAVLCLAIGAGLAARAYPRHVWAHPVVWALCGMAAVPRPYLLPITVALALLLTPRWAGWARVTGPLAAAAISAAVTVGVAIVVPNVFMPPVQATRAGEAVLAVDAMHLDCEYEWAELPSPRAPVSPPGLWRDPDRLCDLGKPGSVSRVWIGLAEPTSPPVLDGATWWAFARPNLSTVIAGRLQHTWLLLLDEMSRTRHVDDGVLLGTPALMGQGARVGYPSQGGLGIVLLSGLSSYAPGGALVWVLAPLVVAIIGATRRLLPTRLVLLGLWPLLGVLATGVLSPANDARYMTPWSVTSWLIALALLGFLQRGWNTSVTTVASPVLAAPTADPGAATEGPDPMARASTHRASVLRVRARRTQARRRDHRT